MPPVDSCPARTPRFSQLVAWQHHPAVIGHTSLAMHPSGFGIYKVDLHVLTFHSINYKTITDREEAITGSQHQQLTLECAKHKYWKLSVTVQKKIRGI